MDHPCLSDLVSKMLDRFPLMCPNRNFTEYEGFFSVGGCNEECLHVRVPHLPSVKDMEILSMSEKLEELTTNCKHEYSQWFSSRSKQFFDFMVWLQNLALKCSGDSETKQQEVPFESWKRVVASLALLGHEHLESVNNDNSGHLTLKLKLESVSGTHILSVDCLADETFTCQCTELPELAASAISECNSIEEAFEALREQVEKLQPFWKIMREIGEEAWVLDPIEPNLSHTRRQICIEAGLSVTVSVDPFNPLSMPEVTFLGPTSKTDALQQIISNQEWEVVDGSLLQSLEKFLQIKFATAPVMESSQLSQDQMCNICFDSEGLNRTCEMCNGQFHEVCLLGWLQSVPSNQTVFNRIAGQCPLCKQIISCVITGL